MNHQPENTAIDAEADDVAWLKSLAESGRNAPLQMGSYLAAGGGWFGAASLALALMQLGVLSLPASAVGWIWIVSSVGFGLSLFALIRRDSRAGQPGNNRLINAAWSGAGFGIFVFWLAAAVVAYRLNDGAVMNMISLAVLVIYGIMWWMVGSLTGAAWMRTLALLSFASTLPVAFAVNTPFVWLAYTSALTACALLPGLYLMRVGGRAV